MLNCIHDSLYLRSSLAPAVTHVTHCCLGVNQLAVQHNLDTWRAQVRAEERENIAGSAHLKVARAARILNGSDFDIVAELFRQLHGGSKQCAPEIPGMVYTAQAFSRDGTILRLVYSQKRRYRPQKIDRVYYRAIHGLTALDRAPASCP